MSQSIPAFLLVFIVVLSMHFISAEVVSIQTIPPPEPGTCLVGYKCKGFATEGVCIGVGLHCYLSDTCNGYSQTDGCDWQANHVCLPWGDSLCVYSLSSGLHGTNCGGTCVPTWIDTCNCVCRERKDAAESTYLIRCNTQLQH